MNNNRAKRELLRQILNQEGIRTNPIPKNPGVLEGPVSFAQQRLWFVHQLDPLSPVYNIALAMRLKGVFNLQALKQSLEEIIRRHKVLKTNFYLVDGTVKQQVVGEGKLVIRCVDLRHLSKEALDEQVQCLAILEARRPFLLDTDALFRIGILKVSESEHILLATIHHIVSDGWSIGILVQEMIHFYTGFLSGSQTRLPELPIQYMDYATWQRQNLDEEALENHISYWKSRLKDCPPVFKLREDYYIRPEAQTQGGGRYPFRLSKTLTKALKALSHQENATLFMLLLTAFQVLLHWYSGREDVVVGTDVANRNHIETQSLIGFFVNILVLRSDLHGNPLLRDLLRQVRNSALDAFEYQDMPFEKLVEVLQPERSLEHTPIVQVFFVFQNISIEMVDLPNLTLQPMEVAAGTAKFDLLLTMWESEQEVAGTFEYRTELFDEETVCRMANHLQVLLQKLDTCLDARLDMIADIFDDVNREEGEAKQRDFDLARRRKMKNMNLQNISTRKLSLEKE